MPERPSEIAAKYSSRPSALGLMAPTPVMTTRSMATTMPHRKVSREDRIDPLRGLLHRIEKVIGTFREQSLGRGLSRRNRDRGRLMRHAAADVPDRVPDDHDVAGAEAASRLPLGALDRDRREERTILGIAPVRAEGEKSVQVPRLELHPRPRLDVPREEAERQLGDRR